MVQDAWILHYRTQAVGNRRDLFPNFVLSVDDNGFNIALNSLKTLSLSEASLNMAIDRLPYALNFSQLQSLTLHGCRNTSAFLNHIVDSGQSIVLSSLEFVLDDAESADRKTSALSEFLQCFEGLKRIHLLVKIALPTRVYWQSAKKHRTILRSFVYHERALPGDLVMSVYRGTIHSLVGKI